MSLLQPFSIVREPDPYPNKRKGPRKRCCNRLPSVNRSHFVVWECALCHSFFSSQLIPSAIHCTPCASRFEHTYVDHLEDCLQKRSNWCFVIERGRADLNVVLLHTFMLRRSDKGNRTALCANSR